MNLTIASVRDKCAIEPSMLGPRPVTPIRNLMERSSAPARRSADLDLLNRTAKGDKLAMQALFARHNIYVYRFVLNIVGDDVLAEDLVSEVFLEVWRHADRFKGESAVTTWILGIARFKALSALRRRKEDALDDTVAAAIPDLADDPEISLQKKDRFAILRDCMSHLSHAHREIIDLTYYREKSVSEVAEIVGVPVETVRTRMFYARKRMSELLHQAGVDRTYQ